MKLNCFIFVNLLCHCNCSCSDTVRLCNSVLTNSDWFSFLESFTFLFCERLLLLFNCRFCLL